MSETTGADRESALALLREQHAFPGPYTFRIVVRPPEASTVVSAVVAALGQGTLTKVDERLSRTGKYLSLHLHVQIPSVEGVLMTL